LTSGTLPDARFPSTLPAISGANLTGVGVAGITSNADATAITIDSAENVGFGSAPTSFYSGYTGLQLGGNGALYGQTSAGANKNLWVSQNARAGTDGSEKAISTGTSSQVMMADGNVIMKTGASASADANVTWTTGIELLASGKARTKNGLLFGTDTAAANALNDYEEGTWTPALASNTTSCSMGTIYTSHYTKIGNVVKLYTSFDIDSSANPATGVLRFTGFPFALKTLGEGSFLISIYYNYKAAPMAFMSKGGYTYYSNTTVDGNNLSNLTETIGQNTTNVMGMQFSYLTDA
jgi:hypothetical protein